MNRIWTNLNKGELQVEPATTFYRDTLDYWGGWFRDRPVRPDGRTRPPTEPNEPN
jgi:hypothetical protein